MPFFFILTFLTLSCTHFIFIIIIINRHSQFPTNMKLSSTFSPPSRSVFNADLAHTPGMFPVLDVHSYFPIHLPPRRRALQQRFTCLTSEGKVPPPGVSGIPREHHSQTLA